MGQALATTGPSALAVGRLVTAVGAGLGMLLVVGGAQRGVDPTLLAVPNLLAGAAADEGLVP